MTAEYWGREMEDEEDLDTREARRQAREDYFEQQEQDREDER